MNRNRVLGVLIGAAILVSIFALPFAYRGGRPMTLFEIFEATIQWRGIIPSELTMRSYSFAAVFPLLVVAGALGVRPLASGAISLVTMASFSVIFYIYGPAAWGYGFYFIWIEALVAFANGYSARFTRTSDRS